MANKGMAYIIMAYIGMAYIVMAHMSYGTERCTGLRADMRTDVCADKHVHRYGYSGLCVAHKSTDTCTDMCRGMRADMCTGVRAEMCAGMCTDCAASLNSRSAADSFGPLGIPADHN